jgi:hypothetical protein
LLESRVHSVDPYAQGCGSGKGFVGPCACFFYTTGSGLEGLSRNVREWFPYPRFS